MRKQKRHNIPIPMPPQELTPRTVAVLSTYRISIITAVLRHCAFLAFAGLVTITTIAVACLTSLMPFTFLHTFLTKTPSTINLKARVKASEHSSIK
jgi:hypothetical protein